MAPPLVKNVVVSSAVNGAASNADLTTEVVDCREYAVLWYEIRIAGTSSPVFNIYYKGGLYAGSTNLDASELPTQTLAAGDTSVEAGVTLHADGYVAVAGSTTNKKITICIENPPRFSALFLDWISGGSSDADKITVRHWLTGREP